MGVEKEMKYIWRMWDYDDDIIFARKVDGFSANFE